jgi:xanthine dehydrogenase YagS FAD-binding subunit
MRPFDYSKAATPAEAVRGVVEAGARSANYSTNYLAGGTTVLDLMKLDVMQPSKLVDIRGMAGAGLKSIDATPGGLRIGALVRMTDAAEHATVMRDYPVLSESLWLAASQQLRNMATIGGNVLQRTRCSYFRDVSVSACNKRTPGSGCAALEGVNRQHAVLGGSGQCIATYPGDFAQALIALDARVEVLGASGPRSLAFAALHVPPQDTPEIETTLEPGDLITAITISAGPWTRRSLYLKIRDRDSYQFALASAAIALWIADGKVAEARIGLGGVATVPWRARAAEQLLRGRTLNDATARAAAELAFKDAVPRKLNAYKVTLGKRTLERALLAAAAMEV